MKYGAYPGDWDATRGPLDDFTMLSGEAPSPVVYYREFGDALLYPGDAELFKGQYSPTPMITWEPWKASLDDIASGKWDTYIAEEARSCAALGQRVLIRFAHEMNGTWYPWAGDPAAYRVAWNHIVTLMRSQDRWDNIRYVWCPNENEGGSFPFAHYWPGGHMVSQVGLDGYNFGHDEWRSPYDTFKNTYAQLPMTRHSVTICETACEEDARKPQWIRNVANLGQRFPRVKTVCWFNEHKERDWRIDSSPAALKAYRQLVAQP